MPSQRMTIGGSLLSLAGVNAFRAGHDLKQQAADGELVRRLTASVD
jgi:hypothetical protein